MSQSTRGPLTGYFPDIIGKTIDFSVISEPLDAEKLKQITKKIFEKPKFVPLHQVYHPRDWPEIVKQVEPVPRFRG